MERKIAWRGDRVAIRPIPLETNSGLIIPNSEKAPEYGEVVNLSSKVDGLSVGDKVIYPKYIGTGIPVGDEELLVFSACQILATITEK